MQTEDYGPVNDITEKKMVAPDMDSGAGDGIPTSAFDAACGPTV
jgi:hypothetical protein